MLLLQSAVKKKEVQRITFTQVSKKAVEAALASPRTLSMPLIESYKGRRALDYLMGFDLSLVLWKKMVGCMSAGEHLPCRPWKDLCIDVADLTCRLTHRNRDMRLPDCLQDSCGKLDSENRKGHVFSKHLHHKDRFVQGTRVRITTSFGLPTKLATSVFVLCV